MAAEDLLRGAAVRIDIGRTPSGTGFFTAPGQVLTCAHVIEPAILGSSTVSSQIEVVDSFNRRHEVTVDPATDLTADLAWLRLPTAPVDVPIAVLFRDVTRGDELATYAFPQGKLQGVPATFEVEGFTGGSPRFIKFKEGQVQPGMSGAPLLNPRTGAVCGVVRRTRDEQQALGGYGISVEAIERSSFYRDLQRHITAAHHAKSVWLEGLTAEQRRRLRSVFEFDEPALAVEFVINIRICDDGWVVDGSIQPGGEYLGPVAVDLNSVRAEVARLFRAWKSQGRIEDTEQARLLGRVLYRAVVPQILADELENYMFKSPDTRVNLNLHFAGGTALDLVHLPWEQLYVPGREARAGVSIGLQNHATLTRVLTPDPGPYDPPRASQLTVLLVEAPRLISANAPPDGSRPPRAQEVCARAGQLLSACEHVEVVKTGPVSAEKLGDLLTDDPFTVVHYVGYGRYHGKVDELALDNGSGGVVWLGPDDFADLINAPPTQLVVLQACMGPRDLVPGDLTVLAKRLLQSGVEAVVACQFPTQELAAAEKLVDLLYHQLVTGSSLRVAVQRVRKALKVKPWTQPALFCRHPGDLRLVAHASSFGGEMGAWRGSASG